MESFYIFYSELTEDYLHILFRTNSGILILYSHVCHLGSLIMAMLQDHWVSGIALPFFAVSKHGAVFSLSPRSMRAQILTTSFFYSIIPCTYLIIFSFWLMHINPTVVTLHFIIFLQPFGIPLFIQ